MNAQMRELREQRAATLDAMKEIEATAEKDGRAVTAEEQQRFNAYEAEQEQLTAKLKRLETIEAAEAEQNVVHRQTTPDGPERTDMPMSHISVVHARSKHFPNREDAIAAGQWVLAHVYDRQDAREWCLRKGLQFRAQAEGVAGAGGVLVPDVLEDSIINLREAYGIFRQFAKNRVMSSDHQIVPRQTSDATAAFIAENTAISDSQKAWDSVGLTAKKAGALVRVSSEVSEDAVVSIADEISDGISYQFARLEDLCGFNGDGTAAYGGIVGLRHQFRTAGLLFGCISAAAGNEYYWQIDAADIANAMAAITGYAEPGARWYTSHAGWMGCMLRLLMAQSGASAREGMEGAKQKTFFGYPVSISDTFPGAATDCSDICMFLFGDLSQSSSFGDRRGVSIVVDRSRYLEFDQIGIRGIERFDIVNHDVGTAAVAGPVAGLRGVT